MRIFCFSSSSSTHVTSYLTIYSLQVEALAVKLTQNEGELIQEKFEVKKLVNFLKQVLCRLNVFCK